MSIDELLACLDRPSISIQTFSPPLPCEADPTTFELSFARNYDKTFALVHKDLVSKQTTGMVQPPLSMNETKIAQFWYGNGYIL